MPLLRPANLNLLSEVLIRIALFSAFCYMESMSAFVRVILPSTLENECKFPHKESYVPGSMLWAIVLSVPCLLSLFAWATCNDCNDAMEILLAWSLALGINGVFTNTLKLMSGRHRPDFFYRCYPEGVETTDLQCSGDPQVINDGRKSFPSGHSSLAFCSLGVAAAWLCGRLGVLSRRRGRAPRTVACLAPLLLALCIAVSRSCDYHHHWEDILAGSAIGLATSFFCYRQYYNPLDSEHSGIPYIVSESNKTTSKIETQTNSEVRESSPLLNGSKKEDKWI